jgi:hypothetical protein
VSLHRGKTSNKEEEEKRQQVAGMLGKCALTLTTTLTCQLPGGRMITWMETIRWVGARRAGAEAGLDVERKGQTADMGCRLRQSTGYTSADLLVVEVFALQSALSAVLKVQPAANFATLYWLVPGHHW